MTKRPSAMDKLLADALQSTPEGMKVDMYSGRVWFHDELLGVLERKFIPFRKVWKRSEREKMPKCECRDSYSTNKYCPHLCAASRKYWSNYFQNTFVEINEMKAWLDKKYGRN